jgi:HEAT repeat protein
MNTINDGPLVEVEQLLRHGAADVRAVGARLAGKLNLAYLRPVLRELESDPVEHVRRYATSALSLLAPDGGRGSEIFKDL